MSGDTSLRGSLLHILHETISKQRQKKLCWHTGQTRAGPIQPSRRWELGTSAEVQQQAKGNPDREVPNPAHPQKYRFLCCLSSHLLLLQQVAEDRIVLGLDPGYRLLLRAQSARLHGDLQCSPLPPYGFKEAASANGSSKHSWCLALLLGSLQHSLWPALQSLLLLLPLQAGSTRVTNQPCQATILAQGLHGLPLGILAQGGSVHSHPVSLGASTVRPCGARHSRVSGSHSCAALQTLSRLCRSGGRFLRQGHQPASTATR